MVKNRIMILGAGLVGKAMALDLHRSGFKVLAVDQDARALEALETSGVEILCCVFFDERVKRGLEHADLVVGAAPGALGYGVMEMVIGAGKDMVDISFCPEDFMDLDHRARKAGVTVVADMGVAPGMCNALLGHHAARMDVSRYRCLVGGLPFKREWPLEYKSSWSPMDCIEEYVRPARLRENGQDVTKPALSDREIVRFPETGDLEAWNSDGLRSLLTSYPGIPDMVEKTLRYPGTVEYLEVLRELGYFSSEEVDVKGRRIRPVDLTAALLFPRFRLEKGEGEFTLMQVEIEGRDDEGSVLHRYDLYDEYDSGTDTLSMARTTGYTCTGVARMILDGVLTRKGILPPERAAEAPEQLEFLLRHLMERGVQYKHSLIRKEYK